MKKYIIAIKLKNEKYERYYYNKKRCNFGLILIIELYILVLVK